MAITSADLKFYYSGGEQNTNPFESYGGAISNTEIPNDIMHNLWSDPDPADIRSIPEGVTDYRLIYLKNTSGSDTAAPVHVYWPVFSSFTRAELSHKGINITCERPLNAKIAPTAAEIGASTASPAPFVKDTDRIGTTRLRVSSLPPGAFIGIWIKRHIEQNQTSIGRVLAEISATIPSGDEGTGPPAHECPSGFHWDSVAGGCVADTGNPTCPSGFHYDSGTFQCLPDVPNPPQSCPSNYRYDGPTGMCVADITTHPGGSCPTGFHYDSATGMCISNYIDTGPGDTTTILTSWSGRSNRYNDEQPYKYGWHNTSVSSSVNGLRCDTTILVDRGETVRYRCYDHGFLVDSFFLNMAFDQVPEGAMFEFDVDMMTHPWDPIYFIAAVDGGMGGSGSHWFQQIPIVAGHTYRREIMKVNSDQNMRFTVTDTTTNRSESWTWTAGTISGSTNEIIGGGLEIFYLSPQGGTGSAPNASALDLCWLQIRNSNIQTTTNHGSTWSNVTSGWSKYAESEFSSAPMAGYAVSSGSWSDSCEFNYVPVGQQPPQTPTCPTGYTWNSATKQCDSNTSPGQPVTPTCPSNYHWDSNVRKCVIDSLPPPTYSCPTGQHWDNTTHMCVPDVSTNCPTGYHWDAALNRCVIDPPVHTCPSGTHWDDGLNKCIPDCAAGSHWDDTLGRCVSDTPTTCPVGQHWDPVTGGCVLDTPPPTTGMPYADLVKPGGYQTTDYTTQQGDCVSDGKRWNSPSRKNVVNMHSWVKMTLLKAVTSSCTDKPWFSPKMGSHADSNSFLVEASIYWAGGFKSCRIEAPHGSYGSIDSSMVRAKQNIPPFPIGRVVGIYVAQWVTPDNQKYISQWWYDFVNGGNGPWTLYAQITGDVDNIGGERPLEGGPGNWQLVGDESECEYEYRGNGMTATLQEINKQEINPPSAPRGAVSELKDLNWGAAELSEDVCTVL